ncbi:MAG: DUF86 domain-containing protein [Archaeoglobus sp.]|uniref:DUF86 domain-containing protein n=1 Tax=Archaeoglobus sp. TaxID=1872626 RepID=UPI001E183A5A|nr:HepT-like ribonuclease domain-containing protein [Archaeoglobus sp.]MBO8179728.1 DUF86 domain-containing protein [Archaeoglobus sp.]
MRLAEYILRFERHLKGAVNLKSKVVKDYFIYNTLAMECSQGANPIDLAQYIVAKKKLGFPSTYRELFEVLESEGYISEDELKIFKRLIFLRNLIAHEYYRISESELLEMVNLLEKCSGFVSRIKAEADNI